MRRGGLLGPLDHGYWILYVIFSFTLLFFIYITFITISCIYCRRLSPSLRKLDRKKYEVPGSGQFESGCSVSFRVWAQPPSTVSFLFRASL